MSFFEASDKTFSDKGVSEKTILSEKPVSSNTFADKTPHPLGTKFSTSQHTWRMFVNSKREYS